MQGENMNRFSKYISSQFKNPRGIGGVIITMIQNVVNRAMYKDAVSLIDLQSNENILDIGYGNGHLLEMIYKKRPANLYGIDISSDAKEMAAKKNQKAESAGQLHLTVGDCCDLPYEDDMFDAVTSINTVYFWPDTVKGLSEIRRTLKRGSSFYNIVFTKAYLNKIKYTQTGYKKFESEELVEYGKQAGFERIEIKQIVSGKSYVVIYTK